MSNTWFLFLLLISAGNVTAQVNKSSGSEEYISGIIKTKTEEGSTPLVGANVFWEGTTTGVATNTEGRFKLQRHPEIEFLVISFVGYQNDTIRTSGKSNLEVFLNPSVDLEEVEVVHRQASSSVSTLSSQLQVQINEKELLKAACCNLSESFETNPSVDVSFTDAVTGTRQIRMLGLAGPYTQITRENMPHIRGLSAVYGLTYVPGPWIHSIQMNKGAGSVTNGFESITGQINVELRKPETADRLYLNGYTNEGGRLEANVIAAHQFKNDSLSTALLLHASDKSMKVDRNNDSFLDKPLGSNLIAINRWRYIGKNGWRAQLGLKVTSIEKNGGQVEFNPGSSFKSSPYWGMEIDMNRMESWMKIGKVYETFTWRSLGFQLSGTLHEQDSYFGRTLYDANQESFYFNSIYQSILSNTNHKFKTGLSFQYDTYDEYYNDDLYERTEAVPGAYFEYTYNYFEEFNLVAGVRYDQHNIYGGFVTPRMHLRYAPFPKTVFRLSGGRGLRTAGVFAENNAIFASSRQVIIEGDDSNKPYGLKPEIAWNMGGSILQRFTLNQREVSLTLDFFRTSFQNQVVLDLDRNPQQAVFYNLNGKSYSNSFQVQVDYPVLERLDARLAYRWYDVKSTFDGDLKQMPLVAKHRAFANLGYESLTQWKFDLTVNWQGQKRIPSTASNPEQYQKADWSPDFFQVNGQISKIWMENLDVYIGVENLLNQQQSNPILASDAPFSEYFDSSLIWGSVMGRNIYMGFRYRL